MNSLARLSEWQNFYMLLGGSTATLAGLLFVAMSLNMNFIHQRHNLHFKCMARLTFQTFLNLLIVSLIFEVPRVPALVLGVLLAGVGGNGTISQILLWNEAKESLRNDPQRKLLERTSRVVFASYLLLTVNAVVIARGNEHALLWIMGPLAGLLMLAARGSWILLTLLQERDHQASHVTASKESERGSASAVSSRNAVAAE